MVEITFIEESGNKVVVDAPVGDPLMYAARDAGVEGIIAECGGSAMCATCHCYVMSAPDDSLSEPTAAEADTIEFMANEPQENSRLTCQLVVTEGMAGAVFQVATGR